MRAAGLALLVCLAAFSYVSGQTFQYSKGWTNGRKRASGPTGHHQLLGPDDRAPSMADYAAFGPSSRHMAANRDALRSFLDLNKQNALDRETISDFISRKRSQSLNLREDDQQIPAVFDEFNNNN